MPMNNRLFVPRNNFTPRSISGLALSPTTQQAWANNTSVVTNTLTRTYEDSATIFLGSRRDIGEYLIGDIGEVIHYAASLTDAQIATVSRYLGTRWGITQA